MNDPPHASREVASARSARSVFAASLLALFLAMVGYGVVVGNVFDNYENASNL